MLKRNASTKFQPFQLESPVLSSVKRVIFQHLDLLDTCGKHLFSDSTVVITHQMA